MKCKLVNDNFEDNYVNNLLRSRGINDVDSYWSPSISNLESPTNLDNMEEGAKLFSRVLENKGRMLLIVDSDNDGFTSSAIMYQYIHDIDPTINVDYLLHDAKQHGLQDHIETIFNSKEHYDLIILPDSSSNDFVYHERLKELKSPCLILDHHITEEPISDNAVIINNQLSSNYHNKELTGAGVVYQFCRYYDRTRGYNFADKYIDLAAWGIIGDMGGVNELENRYIIKEGLSHIQNGLLIALMEKQGYSITGKMGPSMEELKEAMNPTTVAFYIVPLVNAMIRVGTQDEKERLFEAFVDGNKLIPSQKRGAKGLMVPAGTEAARECSNARSRQNKMLEKAIDTVEAKIFKYDLLENRILFVRLDDDDDFPATLNGLVAMKLSAKYKRPTIVARLNDEGLDKGSMRGLNDSAMESFKDFLGKSELFDYVSGHDNAAGISIPDKNLFSFHQYANRALENVDFGENVYSVNFDRFGNDRDLGDLIVQVDEAKGLWGQANKEPLIHVSSIYINKRDIQVMGKNKDTLKFEKNGIGYLKFHAKDLIEQLEVLPDELEVEVVGRANLNEWNGRFSSQIFIEDIDFKDSVCGF